MTSSRFQKTFRTLKARILSVTGLTGLSEGGRPGDLRAAGIAAPKLDLDMGLRPPRRSSVGSSARAWP